MNYTYLNGNTPCLLCDNGAQWLVINPNPAVKGQDEHITLVLNQPMEFPAYGEIQDERGMVVQRFEMNQNVLEVPITRLDMAQYRVVVKSGIDEAEAYFSIGKTAYDKMIISPNPVFKEVDDNVSVKIVADTPDEEFEVTVADASGSIVHSFGVESKNFLMDVSRLNVGSYVITATGQNSVFQEILELTMKGKPIYQVSPNPATSQITSDVENALNPESEWTITIRDKMGVVVKEEQNQIPPFQTNLNGLPSDLYYIQISNQSEVFYKILRKN